MTLQQHFNLIKEGKGNKAQFLKQAKHLFPQYINQYSDFDTATHVLKSKQIISEAAGGVVSKGFDIFDWKKILTEIKTEDLNSNTLYQYDGLFTLGANEGKKVKGTCKYIENIGTDNSRFRFKWVKVDSTNADYAITDGSSFFTNKDGLKYITPIKSLNESVKAEEKETSKEVKDYDKHNFDNKDMKNADNINFNEIMKGFYAELRDEKNNGKTGDEIKAMVVKNLAKDPLYYTKNGEFGVKDLGYTTEAPGLGEPKEPKGKYKSSGYGDLDTEGKVEKVKANVQDSLGDREAKTSNPSKIKEMPVAPQNASGVKKMPMPGVEKKIKLKENVNSEVDEVYQMPSVGQLSGGGGKRFIPKQIAFPSQIRKKFGDHILFNPSNNQLYISQILFNNLIKGGANQPDIKRMIMDIPMMVKQILNKSENYGPVVNFPNKEFKVYLPLNAVVEKATEDKFNKDGTKQYWAKDDLLIPNLNVQEDLEEQKLRSIIKQIIREELK